MRLDTYSSVGFSRGRPALVEAAWLFLQALLVESFVPGSSHRVLLLRMFGAKIGRGVVIKPGVRVKFPWRLRVGDQAWIGEAVWIDNLADVQIGSHAVVSQGAYVCTGSHDWSKASFDLQVRPVVIADQAWVCARAVVAPGTNVGRGAVVGLGAIVSGTLSAWTIYRGNPAQPTGTRKMST